jgi:hypothetical protein
VHSPTPRRALLTRLAFAATLLALVALLASCGGDDDDDGGGGGGSDTASFCDEVKSILTSDNDQGGAEEQARRFQDAIERLQKVEPPEDISEDWNMVMDAWNAEEAADVDLEATQKAGQRVQTYLGEECDLTEENTN